MAKRLLFIFTPQMAFFSSLKQPSSPPRGNELGQQEDKGEIQDSAQPHRGTSAAPLRARWLLLRGQDRAAPALPRPGRVVACRPQPCSPTRGGRPGSHRRPPAQPPHWARKPEPPALTAVVTYSVLLLILPSVSHFTRNTRLRACGSQSIPATLSPPGLLSSSGLLPRG